MSLTKCCCPVSDPVECILARYHSCGWADGDYDNARENPCECGCHDDDEEDDSEYYP